MSHKEEIRLQKRDDEEYAKDMLIIHDPPEPVDLTELSNRSKAAYLESEFGIITKLFDREGNEIKLF